jgi:hypothetical protein
MKHTRCEEVIIQLVVRTYDDDGRPVREQVSQPAKVFRNAETRDFWTTVDQAVAAMEQQAPQLTVAPTAPAPVAIMSKPKRGRG